MKSIEQLKSEREEAIRNAVAYRTSFLLATHKSQIVNSAYTLGVEPLSTMIYKETQRAAMVSVQKVKRPWWRFWR